MLMRFAALVGGVSPQTALTSVSVDTTCPALINSVASTARHFGAPIPRHSSPTRTSSGPSSRNLIILWDHSLPARARPPPLKTTQPRLNWGVNGLPDDVRELALDGRRRRRRRAAVRGRHHGGAVRSAPKTPARQAGWVRRERFWPGVRGPALVPGPPAAGPVTGYRTGPAEQVRARGPAQPGQRAAADMAVVPEPLAGGGSDGHRAPGAALEPGRVRSPTGAVSSGHRRGW